MTAPAPAPTPEVRAALDDMAERLRNSPESLAASLPNLRLEVVDVGTDKVFDTKTGEPYVLSTMALRREGARWLEDATVLGRLIDSRKDSDALAVMHRVAACVNACAGVSDVRGIPDMLDAFAAATIAHMCEAAMIKGEDRYYLVAFLTGEDHAGGLCSVNTLAKSARVVQEAFAWLSARGYATLEREGDEEPVEFIRMVHP